MMCFIFYFMYVVCGMSFSSVFYSCFRVLFVFFFMQKTAYEMRISDWSSDVCSSDLTFVKRALGVRALTIGRDNLAAAHEESDILPCSFGQNRLARLYGGERSDTIFLRVRHNGDHPGMASSCWSTGIASQMLRSRMILPSSFHPMTVTPRVLVTLPLASTPRKSPACLVSHVHWKEPSRSSPTRSEEHTSELQ